jgi:hypothetical protein
MDAGPAARFVHMQKGGQSVKRVQLGLVTLALAVGLVVLWSGLAGTPRAAAQPAWDVNQCDDRRDNDADVGDDNNPADSDVNDGCPQVGSFSEAAVAGGCTNNIDEADEDPGAGVVDDDRIVNDGCLTPKGTQEEDGPPNGLQCGAGGLGNGLDEDGDTVVDDGCTGGPLAAGPVGQPEVTNACANATDDDDMDGRINDGCPAVGAAETDCTDTPPGNPIPLDDDGDTFVNDGCPVFDNLNFLNPPAGDPDISEANPPVGGIAEAPALDGSAANLAEDSSGLSAGAYAAMASAAVSAALVLSAGVVYARRRRLS